MTLIQILKLYRKEPRIRVDSLEHFDQLVAVAPAEHLRSGIAGMLRSSSTASFGQTFGIIFREAAPQERAELLNALFGPGRAAFTAETAAAVGPDSVESLAGDLGRARPSVIDSVAGYLASRPHLVRLLGSGSVAVAMTHMSA